MYLSNYLHKEQQESGSFAYWDGAFSDDELEKITLIGESLGVKESTLFRADGDIVNQSARKSMTTFITPSDETYWIFAKLNEIISNINNSYFKFNLSGYDFIQYTKYPIDGYYKKHTDYIPGVSQTREGFIEGMRRKLSITILLNEDFTGGDFVLNFDGSNDQVIETRKGRIIAFPSYVAHEVTTVTSKERLSLVIWVLGEPWR